MTEGDLKFLHPGAQLPMSGHPVQTSHCKASQVEVIQTGLAGLWADPKESHWPCIIL